MKSTVLATVVALATPNAQPTITFDCAAFRKQPDGAWTVVKTTLIVIENREKRTRDEMVVYEGTRYPPDTKAAVATKDDFVSALVQEMGKGVDLVGALNKRCR